MERPAAAAPELADEDAPVATIAAIPGSTYPIRYAGLAAPGGACADTETRFRRRATYLSAPQFVILRRERLVLDTRFGSLLREAGGAWETVPDAFNRPYAPGEAAYLADINTVLPRQLRRDLVDDLTAGGPWQFPLLSRWSRVYFHLLSESLSQIQFLAGAAGKGALRAITTGNRTSVQEIAQSHLAFMGIEAVEARSRFCWVDNAIFYTGFFRHASINDIFAGLVRTVRRRAGSAAPSRADRLIYVSRLGAKARPLDNEAALAAVAQRLGFEIVDPGELTFLDQVALFSQARVVAGPHGAGLANAAFCSPGSILLELRPLNRPGQSPMLNESYRRICAVQNLQYDCAIFANPPEQDGWSIDVDRAARLLDLAARRDRVSLPPAP